MIELLAILIFNVFLLSKAIEGPLRYALLSAGIEWAIYLPMLLLVVCIVVRSLQIIVKDRIGRPALFTLAFLSFAVCVGTILVGKPLQVLFGTYVWLPLIFGLMFARELIAHLLAARLFYLLLLALSTAGVVLDFFLELPWTGFEYEVSGVEIPGNREWSTFGIDRLSGFARTSYDAAITILFLAIPVVLGNRNVAARTVIWIACGAAILLTTTKGVVLSYIVVTGLLVARDRIPHVMRKLLAYAAAIFVISLPIFSWIQLPTLDLDDEMNLFLLASFEDRLINTWPDAKDLIDNHGSMLGRGLGGIGVAQARFEPDLYNAADNLFVYVFGIAGLLSVAIVFWIARRVAFWGESGERDSRLCYLWGMGILIYGITTNIIESSYLAAMLGIVLSGACMRGQVREAVSTNG